MSAVIAFALSGCTPGLSDRIDFAGLPWHIIQGGGVDKENGARIWFRMDGATPGTGHATIEASGCGTATVEVSMKVGDDGRASSGDAMTFPDAARLASQTHDCLEPLLRCFGSVHHWRRVDEGTVLLEGDPDLRLQAELGA